MPPIRSLRRPLAVRLSACLITAIGAIALGPTVSLNAASDEVIGWGDDSSGQATPWSNLSGVVAIAAGYHHSLALRTDGSVTGWGNDSWGQASGSHWVGQIGIAAGNSYSLSFSSGNLNGWGQTYNGTINLPGPFDYIAAISAGSSHGLALRANGSVVSFGDYTNIPIVLSNVVGIAAGGGHSLALKADGTVAGWGNFYPDYGQANPPLGLSNVVAIAAGGDHSLALKADGFVVSWGSSTTVPAGLNNVVAISAGGGHNLALRADGAVVGWGANSYGQSTVPAWLSNVVMVAAGGNFSLALRGRAVGLAAPVPVAPRSLIGTVDRPFQQRIFVKNGANVYAASGLPPGLVLIPNTGLISGQPTAAGTFPVEFSATNSQGACAWTAPFYVNLPLPFVVSTNFAPAAFGNWFELSFTSGNADSLQISGLPSGLSADPAQGRISGVPSVPGEHAVTMVASNRFGTATNSLVIRVSEVTGWGDNTDRQVRIPAGLSNVVAITACGDHSLSLRADGSVVGWLVPGSLSTLSNVVRIAAGYDHNLALRADGSVAAWGINTYGQTAIPAGLTNVVAVAAGYYHNLALRSDGSIVAWGRNNFGQTNIPGQLRDAVALAGGYGHSLALRRDGTVVGWGYNTTGQATIPNGLTNVVAIAAGYSHSMALRADGSVMTWGDNYRNQTNTPAGLNNVVAIAAGGYHSLALRADGHIVGWGGKFGFGQEIPPNAMSNVVAIAAGSGHSLALCGRPAGTAPPEPAGHRHFFATADWPFYERITVKNGATAYGAVGLPVGLVLNPSTGLVTGQPSEAGTFSVTLFATNAMGFCTWTIPMIVNPRLPSVESGMLARAGLGNWLSLAAAYDADYVEVSGLPPGLMVDAASGVISGVPGIVGEYSVNVTASNRFGIANGTLLIRVASLVAWGNNSGGQTDIPAGLGNLVQVAAGDLHVLALRPDGRIAAWGTNTSSQTNVPLNLGNVIAIAAGGSHSLALRSDGAVVGWGNNIYGQRTTPPGLTNVIAIAAGASHSLALQADGSVRGWGLNTSGQTTVPAGLTSVVAIAAGNSHSLALRSDGMVVGWGNNNYSQRTIPAGLSNVVAIGAGSFHSLALRSDGTIAAWGQNTSKQATVPAGLSNVLAIAAGNTNSLALRSDGSVVIWGDNSSGQTNAPPGLSNVVALAAGGTYCMALLAAPADQPALSLQSAGGSNLSLVLKGLIGCDYVVQTTSSLDANPAWSALWSGTLRTSTLSLSWTNAGESARWFRVDMPEIPQPGLAIQPAGESKLNLRLQGTAAGTYTIQTATNLGSSTAWTTVWTAVPGNAAVSVPWTNRGEEARFFRVIRP